MNWIKLARLVFTAVAFVVMAVVVWNMGWNGQRPAWGLVTAFVVVTVVLGLGSAFALGLIDRGRRGFALFIFGSVCAGIGFFGVLVADQLDKTAAWQTAILMAALVVAFSTHVETYD